MLAPTVKRLGVVLSLTALAATVGCSESGEEAGPYGKVSKQDECAFIPGEQLLEDEGDTWHAPVEDALTTGCMTPEVYKQYKNDKAQREQDQRRREAARQQAEKDLHDLVQTSQDTKHPEIMLPVYFVCSSTDADELNARWGPAYETYAASWRIKEVEALEAGQTNDWPESFEKTVNLTCKEFMDRFVSTNTSGMSDFSVYDGGQTEFELISPPQP